MRTTVACAGLAVAVVGAGGPAKGQSIAGIRRPNSFEEDLKYRAPDEPVTGKRRLAPISLVPQVGASYDTSKTGVFSPAVHGVFEKTWSPTDSIRLHLQVLANFNSKPTAGSATDVAGRILAGEGTASGQLGLRFSLYPASWNKPSDEGNVGLDFRVSGLGGLQLADTATTTPTIENQSFAIYGLEGTADIFLFALYAGFKANWYWSSGASASVQAEMDGKNSYQVRGIVPFVTNKTTVAGSNTNTQRAQESYVSISYTKPQVGPSTTTLNIGSELDIY